MTFLPIILAAGLPALQITPSAPHRFVGARSLAISPDGENVAFTYRGDIWLADSDGGKAVPLTDNVEMDDNAVWSPDGKWIAFATDRNGNWDIYAVPLEGGQTVQLTFGSFSEIPVSWSGNLITMSASIDKGAGGIYTLDVNNLRMNELWITNFRLDAPNMSADGKNVVFGHKLMMSIHRPRYEGSGASQLWTIGADGKNRKLLRATRFQHLWPQFGPDGKTIYTVTVTEKTPSSRNIDEKPVVFTDNLNRTPNIYRVDANGKASRVSTVIGGDGTRFLTVASKSGHMMYEHDGEIFKIDPIVGNAGASVKSVTFTGIVDDKGRNVTRNVITTGANEATISPDGKSVVFGVNRELFSVPATKGKGPNGADAKQLTSFAGSDTQANYSPDGKSVFFTSDRDGALSLYKLNVEDGTIAIAHKTTTDIQSINVTPDKKSLAYWVNGRQGGLFTYNIATGATTRVIDKPVLLGYSFSPDMRYIAYVKSLINSGFKYWENKSNVWVREIATGKEVNVSKLNSNDNSPGWSADGKYLYFHSDRGPTGIFMCPAQAEDTPSNIIELKYTKPEGEVKVDFDFNRPEDRIRLFNGGAQPGQLYSDKEKGDLYFVKNNNITRVGYDGEKETPVSRTGANSFEVLGDTNSIFYLTGGVPTVQNIRQPNMPTAPVEYRAVWIRNTVEERKAAFHEFWRTYNQNFYDEYFHRRDWAKIRDRYAPLLDSVAHRREMATVLNFMVGELESSHSEVGAAAGGQSSDATAHPGFSIDYSYTGPGIRVKDVPARAPGSFAKTKINAGDYVMKVNGQAVRADQNFFKLMTAEAGRDVTFTVNSRPSTDGAREVTYRAISPGAYGQILYNNRIDWRREYVEKLSGGKATYVHIAGMGGGNLNTFNAEMWEYVQGKEAVIIDVRENGGGNIADILIDALERRMHLRYQPRDQDEMPGPGQLWGKPTVVMHAETSFSNAEMFPAAMKTLGLATLVGMQTPGYVIYTYGGVLVDGTVIRLPQTGSYRVDGTPLENIGEKPDIEVDIDPDQYFRNEDPQLKRAVEELMKQLGSKG